MTDTDANRAFCSLPRENKIIVGYLIQENNKGKEKRNTNGNEGNQVGR